jgi:hypothetical protein
MGQNPAGKSFPDFVAPAGPMPSPAAAPARAPGVISKKIVLVVALVCLLVGGGIGFLVGQSSSSGKADNAAAQTDIKTPPIAPAIDTAALAAAGDAGTTGNVDASVALAAAMDASVEVVVDAGVPDADTAANAAATLPAVPDPGEPKEGECALALAIVPADAVVTIGEVKVPVRATKANLPCGVYPMSITHPKYKNHKGRIVLKATRANSVEHALKAPSVMLTITSIPPRAMVSLDGKEIDRTVMKRLVPMHQPIELMLKRSGFKAHIETITLTKATKLKIRLKKRRRRGGKQKKKSGASSNLRL